MANIAQPPITILQCSSYTWGNTKYNNIDLSSFVFPDIVQTMNNLLQCWRCYQWALVKRVRQFVCWCRCWRSGTRGVFYRTIKALCTLPTTFFARLPKTHRARKWHAPRARAHAMSRVSATHNHSAPPPSPPTGLPNLIYKPPLSLPTSPHHILLPFSFWLKHTTTLSTNRTNVAMVPPTLSPLSNPLASPLPLSSQLEDIHFNLAQEITRAMHPPAPKFYCKPLKVRNSQPRAPIVKPSPVEEELVRRIHRKVGGPSKLSTYDDPAKVRHVVIDALATEQTNVADAARIRKGQLTVFERRVVRTVTNRGAAVRSRMRQRKEVAQLKYELQVRDLRVKNLERMLIKLCHTYDVPLPESLFPRPALEEESSPQVEKVKNEDQILTDMPAFNLDQDMFGNLVDQMIPQSSFTS